MRRRSRVPWVTGCCLLLRRACLDQVGGLDRDYFLYYEDVDLCRRAEARGWSVWYEPSLKVTHHHPLHLREVPPYLRVLTRHAFLTYASKHWPPWQFRILSRIVECEARFRKHFASAARDWRAAEHFADLRLIAADLGQRRFSAARQRLDQVVRREERRRAS
jgi:GT2 family glycosyltransferase